MTPSMIVEWITNLCFLISFLALGTSSNAQFNGANKKPSRIGMNILYAFY
jgi:hypothetical protein